MLELAEEEDDESLDSEIDEGVTALVEQAR